MMRRNFTQISCLFIAALLISSCQQVFKPAKTLETEKEQTGLNRNLPRPDDKPADMTKPVKVFIMMGQSNMVGMGQISGGGKRWNPKDITDAVVSVYEGDYSPDKDYDSLTPIKTEKMKSVGGVKPTPFPGGGTQVLRGNMTIKDTGVYKFKPGYGASTNCIMEVDGEEVYSKKDPKGKPVYKLKKIEGGKSFSFKVTYLNESANGLGWYERTDFPGTLETLVKQQKQYPFIIDEDGNWTVRKDVYYYDARVKKGSALSPLSNNGKTIGPELGFGHVMGNLFDEPVLLIKSCIGNRSLAWDLLPPGSKRYEVDGKVYAGYKDSPASWDKGTEPKPIKWYAGKQYDDDVANAKKVLENIEKYYPGAKEYEIAGFVWWQGHKDQNTVHANRYEHNLVNLIKSLRKDFNAPDAPFVLATIAFEGWRLEEPGKTIAAAQLAIADPDKHPEFAGKVKCVEARDLWRELDVSPKSQNYHYHRNAGTYFDVGLALGQAMADIYKKNK